MASIRQFYESDRFDVGYFRMTHVGDRGDWVSDLPQANSVAEVLRSILDRRGVAGSCTNKAHSVDFLHNNAIRFREDLRFMEDMDFEIRVAQMATRVRFLDRALYFHVLGTGITGQAYSPQKVQSVNLRLHWAEELAAAHPPASATLRTQAAHGAISLLLNGFSSKAISPSDDGRLLETLRSIPSREISSWKVRVARLALLVVPRLTTVVWQVARRLQRASRQVPAAMRPASRGVSSSMDLGRGA